MTESIRILTPEQAEEKFLAKNAPVSDSQLPERLSPEQLNATIAAAVAGIEGGGGGGPLNDSSAVREAVRLGRVTSATPLVAIGDSHTDAGTSAVNMWTRLQDLHSLPGQGLAGIGASSIVAKGKNGQTLAVYLANPTQDDGFDEAMALNPSVVLACWLTNDVRQGALGLTVAAIRAAGAALLGTFITNVKAEAPGAVIVLRVSAPYTTVNTGSDNYITDGSTVNPAGLAQIYTDGVRLANYDAATAHPGVLVYDPQTRFFGTASPSANGGANSGYFGNQIHQNVNGYKAEADDFAAWVDAQAPFNQAAAAEARIVQNPTAPWLAYHRVPEDTSRYVKVAEGLVVRANTGETFFDIGPSFPNAIPNNIKRYDIVVLYGARSAWEITTTSSIAASAGNTRLSGIPAIPAGAAAGTRAAIFRRITTPDDALNVVLRDRSYRYKRTGVVQNGSTSYLDISAKAFSADPVLDASTWATELAAGDKVYVEGLTASPLVIGTDTSSNNASGASTRLLGTLGGIDWSLHVGKAVVITGAHA